MAFNQSRIDRIKNDEYGKFNKYLRREIQLDVLDNEDLPVPYEHSDFISQYEYEAYSYKSDLKKASDIVSQVDPLKRLYYDEILENVKVLDINESLKWERDDLIYIRKTDNNNTTIKPDWHTGYKTLSYSNYPSHQNLIGYKDTMVEKLKINDGILIFPQGYKAFSQFSFRGIGDRRVLKSLKITDGIEALRNNSLFENNYELSDLYTSITLEGDFTPYSGFKNTKVKDIFILSDNIKVPNIDNTFDKTIDSIVIYDTIKPHNAQYGYLFSFNRKLSNNLKKLYIIKTENSNGKVLDMAVKEFGSNKVQSISEKEAFEIMGYDYDLYLKKKKDGISEYDWGELKPEQYNPSITISKDLDPLMLEISYLEKNNDELLEKDKDTIKNSYESIIKGYEDAIKKLQTIEEYDLNTIDESGNILKYIEFLKGRINTKLKVLQVNNNVDKNLIIQNSLNIFKTFIGVHKDDTEEDEFYIFCLSTAYERLQNIDGIKLYSDDISRYFLVSEAQKVLTQSKEETLYEKGLKLTRHYATRGGKDE